MYRRESWVIALVIALCWHASACAMSLSWRGGAQNLDLPRDAVRAVPCTLMVVRSDEPQELDGFVITWVGSGNVEMPGAGLSGLSPATPADLAAMSSHWACYPKLTVGSSETAMRILSVDPGSTVAIAAIGLSRDHAVSGPLDDQPFVTINGGPVGVQFHPMLTTLEPVAWDDSVSLKLFGCGLSHVGSVLLHGEGLALVRVPFNRNGDTLITVNVPERVRRNLQEVIVKGGGLASARLAVPPEPHKAQTILAVLAPHASAASLANVTGVTGVDSLHTAVDGHARAGDAVRYGAVDLRRVRIIHFGATTDAQGVLRAVLSQDGVLEAQILDTPGPRFFTAPNDPLYGEQWALHEVNTALCQGAIVPVTGASIDADVMWALPHPGDPVDVAILDDGVDYIYNADVKTNRDWQYEISYVPGVPDAGDDGIYYTEAHGTACASVAAAWTDNYEGMAGAGNGAQIVSVKWWDPNVSLTDIWPPLLLSLDYVAGLAPSTPMKVANLSFGRALDPINDVATIHAMALACKAAFLQGCLLVAAMGNTVDSVVAGKNYPAGFSDYAMAVGATTWTGERWRDAILYADPNKPGGSGVGSWIDVMAPGVGITAGINSKMFNGPPYVYSVNGGEGAIMPCLDDQPDTYGATGTSMSAALVSGVAADLLRVNPQATTEDVRAVLERTATDSGPTGFDVEYGHGLINAGRAGQLLSAPNLLLHGSVGAGSTDGFALLPDSTSGTLTTKYVAGIANGSHAVVRYHLKGTAHFNAAFGSVPAIWVRRATSIGMPVTSNWNDDMMAMWGGVGGSLPLSRDTAIVETYVYRFTDAGNLFYPCGLSAALVTYTAVAPSELLGVTEHPAPRHLQMWTRSMFTGGGTKVVLSGLRASALRVEVFDVSGRRVRTLFRGVPGDGGLELSWDGRDESGSRSQPGMYFCLASQGATKARARLLLLR